MGCSIRRSPQVNFAGILITMAGMTSPNSSSMVYHGTTTEVQLGDLVTIKQRFKHPVEGTVCYIPGLSRRHPQLEYEDVRKWAIEIADGTVRVLNYFPESTDRQASRTIEFRSRGPHRELDPEVALE